MSGPRGRGARFSEKVATQVAQTQQTQQQHRSDAADSYITNRLGVSSESMISVNLSRDQSQLTFSLNNNNIDNVGIKYSVSPTGKLNATFDAENNHHLTICLKQISKIQKEIQRITQNHKNNGRLTQEVVGIDAPDGCRITINAKSREGSPVFSNSDSSDKSMSNSITKFMPEGASAEVAFKDIVFMKNDAIGILKVLQNNPNISFDLSACAWLKDDATKQAECVLLAGLLENPKLAERLHGYEDRFQVAHAASKDPIQATAILLKIPVEYVQKIVNDNAGSMKAALGSTAPKAVTSQETVRLPAIKQTEPQVSQSRAAISHTAALMTKFIGSTSGAAAQIHNDQQQARQAQLQEIVKKLDPINPTPPAVSATPAAQSIQQSNDTYNPGKGPSRRGG
jgi:hypothetical protein